MLRYEVPVDDQWHTLELSGAVLHVDTRAPDVVEVWALDSGGPTLPRQFRAFGTGQRIPDGRLRHVGSVITAGGRLVWHLFESDSVAPEGGYGALGAAGGQPSAVEGGAAPAPAAPALAGRRLLPPTAHVVRSCPGPPSKAVPRDTRSQARRRTAVGRRVPTRALIPPEMNSGPIHARIDPPHQGASSRRRNSRCQSRW
ncbi:MAG: DUF7352 domain-containing protein [Gammaproteobacteria bacterium]